MEPYNNLIAAMNRQSAEDKILLENAVLAFEELNLHNSIYAVQLINLAKTLVTYSINSIDDPAGELELDRERGMTVNIAAGIRALDEYSKPLREGGEQLVDLNAALLAIFREKERRILNEI